MSRLRPILIVLTGLLLAAALTGLVVRESQGRQGGREVALTLQGVDPRDLLSGHYVAFTLAEPLGENEMCPVTLINSPPGTAWVALSPKRGHWQATGMSPDRAKAARLGMLTVRGEASCDPRGDHQVTLNIGLNRFHAAQADAQRISMAISRWDNSRPTPSYALVSIDKDGHARLKGVQIGAERVMLDW